MDQYSLCKSSNEGQTMRILVLTDEELKSIRMALRLMYLNGPDTQTRQLIDKVENKKVKNEQHR